jgi:pimeloyl-[acyl-carrier protein] synthase
MDPSVLADPYPLYKKLRETDPVHWDPYLHAWVVTGYQDCITVLHKFSADRTPNPEQIKAMGIEQLAPIAQVMTKQMLFMDAPTHTRLRKLCSVAFTSRRIETMRAHIAEIAETLIARALPKGKIDLIADFAAPLPAIVTAEMLGVPTDDHEQLKSWSADFAEMLGNFQHDPDRAARVLKSVEEMQEYFRAAIREQERLPREGLIHSLMTAEVEGARLTEEEIIANTIVTMVGGQETTTNLIGNGMLTLLRNPAALTQLRDDPAIIETAVEELLRYESPSQHTARIAPEDCELGGKRIKKRDAVMAVMAAGNRDPARFADPDKLDLLRQDNRHLAFGWAAHFCFGAPLARMEGQIAFTALLNRLKDIALPPQLLTWRENLGLRGLKALNATFRAA